MLNISKAKEKEAIKTLQKAMTNGDEKAIQEAWLGFHQSVADTVREHIEDDTIISKSEKEGAYMKASNFKNESSFRKKFTGTTSTEMSIEDFGKGVLLNQWGEHKQQANKVDGSILVPVSILSDIIYSASQQSVLLGNCPIIPMTEAQMLIGKIKDDVEPDFKAKYEKGKETNLGLEGVILDAKTLYAYVEISEEDLQDIKNLENILRTAFSGAVAKALDNNFLYTNPNYSLKPGVYPKGILDNENIKQITVDTVDYDMIANANLEIAKSNGKANVVGFNPIQHNKLQLKKDSIGQYIKPPTFYDSLTKIESNGLKTNDVIVFDSNQVLVGIRQQMDIKVMPSLETGTVILRCMLRADVVPTREDHICKINIVDQPQTLSKKKKD